MRSLLAGLLGLSLCAGVVAARSGAGQGGGTAEAANGLFITRIFTGDDSQAHRQAIEVPFTSPPGSAAVSKTFPAVGLYFQKSGPMTIGKPLGDWHPGPPEPKYSVTLTGAIDIEIAGGEKVPVRPGTVLLFEDSTGKGHLNHPVRTEPRLAVQVDLTPRKEQAETGPYVRGKMKVLRIRRGPQGQPEAEPFQREITEVSKVSGFKFVRSGTQPWKTEHARQYLIPLRGRGYVEAAGGTKIPVAVGDVVLAETPDGRALTVGSAVSSEESLWMVFALAD